MTKRALFLLLPLLACSTDIIDHGNGQEGSGGNNRDGGDLPRDGGNMMSNADAGFPDAGGPSCAIWPSTVDFGVREVGTTTQGTLTMRNEFPTATCSIGSVDLPHPAFDFANGPPSVPFTFTSARAIALAFVPTTAGAVESSLRAGRWSFDLFGVAVDPDVASTQTVTFDVANTSTSAVYVLTEGFFCDAFDVGSPRTLGWQCGCECPPPPRPHGRTYVRVEAGASHEVTWDARALQTVPYLERCTDFPDGQTADRVAGNAQPAAPGAYTVTIAYETTVPAHCTDNGATLDCDDFEPALESPPPVAALCPATEGAQVTFTLPAAGDVTVPVPVGS